MIKALNLDDADPAGYAFAAKTGTSAVFVWAPPWHKLEPTRGQIDETAWQRFDQQVAQAQAHKLPTYVAIDSTTPTWAYAAQAAGRTQPAGRAWRLAPDDRSMTGSWAQHVERVLARHPKVQGIAVINEPNVAFMDGHMARDSADLMLSAVRLWTKLGATPLLMGPATYSGGGAVPFTHDLLVELALHHELIHVHHKPFAWAHHHYQDVASGSHREVLGVLELLKRFGWPEEVWLTEGGYQYNVYQDANPDYHADPQTWHYKDRAGDEAKQLRLVHEHFTACKKDKRVKMWAQYEYRDSMWGGWASGLVGVDGTDHPLAKVWATL